MLSWLDSTIGIVLGTIALGTALVAAWRKGRPWVDRKRLERASLHEMWFGRPAVPPNRLTGDPGKPEVLPIGALVRQIHHELHPNGGSSMKDALTRIEKRQKDDYSRFKTIDARLERIEAALAEELRVASDAVANAAEAAATLLPVIDSAIKATPPDIED